MSTGRDQIFGTIGVELGLHKARFEGWEDVGTLQQKQPGMQSSLLSLFGASLNMPKIWYISSDAAPKMRLAIRPAV